MLNDLIARVRKLSSCEISDGLFAVGLPGDGLPDIYPIEPVGLIVGRALTVTFSMNKQDRTDYLPAIEPGDVLVLDNEGRTDCSVWGGLRSIAAIERKAAGTVINGVYRDVVEQRELGYPVFGLKPSVVGGKNGRVVASGYGTTVNIGGVAIATGDIVVGDVSGVVVVPRSRAEEVVAAAEAIKLQDLGKAKMLRAGGTLG